MKQRMLFMFLISSIYLIANPSIVGEIIGRQTDYSHYRSSGNLSSGKQEVRVTQNEIRNLAKEDIILHYDGDPNDGVGTGGAADMICAVRFTADELASYYDSYSLTAIQLHILTNEFSEVIAKVWEGGSAGDPGLEVYSEDITSEIAVNDWTQHILSSPIALQSGNEYWIGYSIAATGGYPATRDAGPAIEGKGDWIYFGDSWGELGVTYGLDYNWNIRGVISDGVAEINITPSSFEVTLDPHGTTTETMTISNAGNDTLAYSISIQPTSKNGWQTDYGNYRSSGNLFSDFNLVKASQSEIENLAKDDIILHYDGDPDDGVGTGGAADMICAVRFTADELASYYDSYSLTAIQLHILTDEFSQLVAKVWEGGNAGDPGLEVYSEDITSEVIVNDWTQHTLSNPVYLQSGNEYWIGYSIAATGGYPATRDAGPAIEGKGDWIYFGDSWGELGVTYGLDYNWNIRGIISEGNADWLSLSIENGSIAPGGTSNINLNFDAGNYNGVTKTANLLIESNANPNAKITTTIPVTMNVNENLVANFQADQTEVPVGTPIQFSDLSTGNPTTWEWDFDNDGTIDSNDQNPSYIYPTPGVYTVSLTVSDGGDSDTETKTDYVTITDNLDYGLVAFYPFTEGSVADSSGNGNDGTKYGAISTNDRFGNANNAYNFDGINDFIRINDSSSLDIVDQITISAWIKKDINVPWASIITKSNDDGENNYSLHNNTDGGIVFTSSSWVETAESAFTIPNSEWHMVTLTWDKNNIKYFVDGTLDVDSTTPLNMQFTTNDAPLYIGVDLPYDDEFFNGTIDDLFLYNRALSDTEIATLYDNYDEFLLADFEADQTEIYAGSAIQFMDLSLVNPTSWEWNFNNDGTIDSYQQNPSYTYSTARVYTVSLTVSNGANSDTESKVDYITVSPNVGNLEGYVTAYGTSDPIENVAVDIASFSTSTNAAGYYLIETIPSGTYDVSFSHPDYSDGTISDVIINPGATTQQNAILNWAEIDVTPSSFEVTLDPYETTTETMTISNAGNDTLAYSISIESTSKNGWESDYSLYRSEGILSTDNQIVRANQNTLNITKDEIILHYDGDPDDGVGTGGAADMICAVRFTADELASYYDSYSLTAIQLHILTDEFSQLVAKVWEGGNAGDPGLEVYSEDITSEVIVNDWTQHTLSNPVYLQSGNEYWIGYSIAATGGYPATRDAGPAIEGKGDWIYFGDSWGELGVTYGLDYNWNIRGIISEGNADWLSLSIENGSIAPGGTSNINLNFDAGNYNGVTKTANLLIESNANPNAKITTTIPVTMNVNENLVANFQADQTEVPVGTPIQFSDLSTGNPTTWEWDFDNDGTIDSNDQNPSCAYVSAGTFSVSLTVNDGTGPETEVKIDYITIYEQVITDFEVDKIEVPLGTAIQFTDLSTGNPTSWEWDFDNDGTIDSNEQNPSTTYTSAGVYTVSLVANNAVSSDSEVKTDYITITENLEYGLIAYYPFTEGSVADSSGNGNNGTNNEASPTTDRFGNENGAFEFDGVNDFINSNNNFDISTISFWFKTDFIGSNEIMGQRYDPVEEENNWQVFFRENESLAINVYNPVYSTSDIINESIVDSKWHHLVLISGSNGLFAYVDNVNRLQLESYTNILGSFPNDDELMIGKAGDNGSWDYFNGSIDDVRIYNRPLSESEIATLFDNYDEFILADFEADQTVVLLGTAIQFTDLSTGNPTSWEWDFDNDGTIDSYEQNPSYTYSTPGVYTVSLTVSDGADSDSETKTDYITVTSENNLLAYYPFTENCNDFSGNQNDGVPSGNLQFSSSGAYFDGSSSVTIPYHSSLDIPESFSLSGWFNPSEVTSNNYTINQNSGIGFLCWDNELETNQDYQGFQIYPRGLYNLPGGWIEYNYNIEFNNWVHLCWTYDHVADSLRLYVNGSLNTEEYYTGTLNSSSNPIIIGDGSSGNGYKGYITELAFHNAALSNEDVVNLLNEGNFILADFEADQTEVPVGTAIQFSDLSSGSPTSWEWDFDNDSTIDSNEQNPSYSYNKTGFYSVSLTVGNGTASDTITKTDYIFVTNQLYEGLVGYYPFTGGSLEDRSVNDNTITNHGAIPALDRFDNANCAYDFTNDYMEFTLDHSSYNDFTQSFWIYVENPSHLNTLGGWKGDPKEQETYLTADTIVFYVRNNGQTLHAIGDFDNFNEWTNITLVFKENQYSRVYMNGEFLAENSQVGVWDHPETNTFIVGVKPRTLSHNFFEGRIDDIRVYNRALSNTEIKANYSNFDGAIFSDFIADQTEVPIGTAIQFTDLSLGNPTTWEWDFDNDGTIDSYEQNPSYIYTTPGIFTVSLTISDGTNSDSEVKTDYITVEENLDFGLVAYYPFTEGSVADSSGNSNDGTNYGASATNDRFGNINSAYEFNGSNTQIVIPDNELLDLSQNYSVSLWLTLDSSRSNHRIINKDGGNDYNSGWCLFMNTPGDNLNWCHYPEDGIVSDHIVIPSSIPTQLWQNIIVTYDGENFSCYINGDFINSATPSGSIGINDLPLEIGGSSEYNQFYDGNIDDIRIYNRVLSESEIATLFDNYDEFILANFEADQTEVPVGTEIQFTDLSLGSPTTWEWDFDNDGTIDSYEKNPVYSYPNAGTYTVSLTVGDGRANQTLRMSAGLRNGDRATSTETKADYITVTELNPEIAISPDSLHFDVDKNVSSQQSQNLTISNTGDAPLEIELSDNVTVTDIDGNVYQTVQIGDQLWMAENLKVTHYNDGSDIPNITNSNTWDELSSGAYCYYDNDPANGDIYGALYNWFAVDTGNLAPEGWHVPTDEEIKQLEMYLGMSLSDANDAGLRGTNEASKLAGCEELWSDGDLVNDSEFSLSKFCFLPGGYRLVNNGAFVSMGQRGDFWAFTEGGSDYAWRRGIYSSVTSIVRDNSNKQHGFSVRCIKNDNKFTDRRDNDRTEWLSYTPTTLTIQPGSSADVTVSVNATALDLGSYEKNLYISSNDPDNDQISIPATMQVTSSEIIADFTVSDTVCFVDSNLQFTDLSSNNPTSWEWDFDNDGTIDSNEENPSYSYPAAGVYTVSLTVSDGVDSDTEVKTDYITVSPKPEISVQPISFSPSIQTGQVYQSQLAIENSGEGTLTWSASVQYNTKSRSVKDDWLNLSVTSGSVLAEQTFDIAVTFDGTNLTEADYTAEIVLSHNDPDVSDIHIPVALNVHGIPDIQVLNSELDFETVFCGYSSTLQLIIFNFGTHILEVSDITIDDPVYSIDYTEFSVPVGEQRTLEITYSPTIEGNNDANLNIYSNDLDENPYTVSLSGSSSLPPNIAVSETDFSFYVMDDASDSNTFIISNTGNYQLNFSFEDLPYWLSCSPEIGQIAAGNDQTITLTANSSTLSPGFYEEEIILTSNDPDEPNIILSLNLRKEIFNFCGDDNENNTLSGVADNDLDLQVSYNSAVTPIEFNIFTDEINPSVVMLGLRAWNVDESNGAVHEVYVNNHLLGNLQGVADEWFTTIFDVNPNYLSASLKNTIKIQVDTDMVGNAITVDWGQLFFSDDVTNAYLRYADMDQDSYYPGSSISIQEEIDTNLPIQNVVVQTSIYAPDDSCVLFNERSLLISLISNESYVENFNLSSEAILGIYEMKIVIYDESSSLIQDIFSYEFEVKAYLPAIYVEVSDLDFGAVVNQSESSMETLLIANIGHAPLDVTNFTFNNSDFSTDELPFQLQTGEQKEVTFTFTPTSEGEISGQLSIFSNDVTSSPTLVDLTGIGVPNVPYIEVTPLSLDFGEIYTVQTDTLSIEIKNSGPNDLIISEISSNNASFTTNFVQREQTIPYLGTMDLEIIFDPQVSGIFEGVISVISNAANEPDFAINVTGEAIIAPSISFSDNDITTNINSSQIINLPFSIFNTGGSDLNWNLEDQFGKMLTFSGHTTTIADYGVIQNKAPIQLFGGNFTVELWFKVNGNLGQNQYGSVIEGGKQCVVSKGNINDEGSFGIFMQGVANETEKKDLLIQLNNTIDHQLVIPDALELDTWYHIATTYYNDMLCVYLNGELVKTEEIIDYSGNREPWVIGKVGQSGLRWYRFDGNVDEFRIYNDHRTRQNIRSTLYSKLSGNEQGLVGYWNFDEENLHDLSSTNADGTVYGTVEYDCSSVTETPDWLSFNSTFGTINSGLNTQISLSVDATNLFAGIHSTNLKFHTNDPSSDLAIIPLQAIVYGQADIAVSSDSLDFENTFIGFSDTISLDINNTGTDTLFITSISTNDPVFSISVTDLTIPPNAVEELPVIFEPTSETNYDASLSFFTNVLNEEEVIITLVGNGVYHPTIDVTPNAINTAMNVGEVAEETITISNLQGIDLEYEIELEEIQARNNVNGVFENMTSNNKGMVWVEGMLYAIDYQAGRLEKYDIDSESIIWQKNIHEAPFGITYDGANLWIGSSSGEVYC